MTPQPSYLEHLATLQGVIYNDETVVVECLLEGNDLPEDDDDYDLDYSDDAR